jgi:hypothetical protein
MQQWWHDDQTANLLNMLLLLLLLLLPGSCGVGKPSWWGSGNDTDKLPVISCVADASQPTGGRWDIANIVGNVSDVCVFLGGG